MTKKEGTNMTMMYEKKNSIWNRVREDRDVDDLIFETEKTPRPQSSTISER